MKKAMLFNASEAVAQEFDWGKLFWYASGKLGNSYTMTIGKCIIKPGRENPRHRHPNCEEVLHVLSGTIVHYIENDISYEMGQGDTITIPFGLLHNAKNTGATDAILIIAFSSAARETEGE